MAKSGAIQGVHDDKVSVALEGKDFILYRLRVEGGEASISDLSGNGVDGYGNQFSPRAYIHDMVEEGLINLLGNDRVGLRGD